ncbi:uncharacterized protein [Centruroides vittatus]|uniref:uncharacterized protein isoform X2 n=1 Tax=Centruroides vittatus TaxID=120091 RepID=UPI00350F60E3
MDNKDYKNRFWSHTLSKAKYIVAPMVDMSELAFRLLCRKYNAQLCYTPMLNSVQYLQDPLYRKEMFTTCKEDRPLIVQFSANDPDIFVAAAKLVEPYCDAVDLNIGCPQAIARRGQYGAFLQDKWDLLRRILRQASTELSVPVTCKIRILSGNAHHSVDYARMLEEAGCSLLAVHGRTRDQKGDLTGIASWQVIKAIKEGVSIPIFANGNILSYEDIQNCLDYTGVEGVMSAEGILHNPALFTGTNPYVWQMVEEYLDLAEYHNTRLKHVRTHLFRLMQHSLEEYPILQNELAVSHSFTEFRDVSNKMKENLLSRITSCTNENIESVGKLLNSIDFNDKNNLNQINDKDCKLLINDNDDDDDNDKEYFQKRNRDYDLPIWLCHSRPRVVTDSKGNSCYRKHIELGRNEDVDCESQNNVSKNVERKIRRHKRIIEAKKARRKRKKECRKEKLAELRKAGIVTHVIQRKNRNLARERMRKVIGHAPRICIDLSFGSMMSEKELHRLSSQLRRLYGSNQNSIKPVHLYFTSFGEENPLYKVCCDKNDGFLNYVNVTLNKAESRNLATARLPIEEYMKRANRGSYCKVLAINQVLDILLQYYITGEWSEALIARVPSRKGFLPNERSKAT